MTGNKRIVCLANSRKVSGRCIAGREWTAQDVAGPWIRLVSERDSQEVSEYERQYEDGSDPKVLDIIDIPVKGPIAQGWQSENWLIEPEYYWRKVGKYSPLDLGGLVDRVEPLWFDGDSTYNGSNDRIMSDRHIACPTSLRLIRVSELTLRVFVPGEAFGNSKRRVQGWFVHAKQRYGLWVTDPIYERQYLAKLNGRYQVGSCYITVSLGDEFRGARYKLIAAIITSEG